VAYAAAIVVLIGQRSIRYNYRYRKDTPGNKDTRPPKGNRAVADA